MFSLVGALVKYLFQRPEYFILVIGLDGAGKTCLVEKCKELYRPGHKRQLMSKIKTTVGLNVGKIDIASLTLTFWDVGGQPDLQCLWGKYYNEVHGVIYVIDSTDKSRLRDSLQAFDTMVDSHDLSGVPLLILANKQDVEGAMDVPEIKVVFNESAPKLGTRDCKVLPVSAVSGVNIKQSLEWLASSVQRNTLRPPAGPEFD
eukprot:m.15907 g.15907  ORF g.15907 m.15907 type:complete len:202 (-) comp10786_c0_seq1:32-637(-)